MRVRLADKVNITKETNFYYNTPTTEVYFYLGVIK